MTSYGSLSAAAAAVSTASMALLTAFPVPSSALVELPWGAASSSPEKATTLLGTALLFTLAACPPPSSPSPNQDKKSSLSSIFIVSQLTGEPFPPGDARLLGAAEDGGGDVSTRSAGLGDDGLAFDEPDVLSDISTRGQF